MTLWLIIPRDPLIFRDGKPFTNSPGSRAKTMPFPYPATIAGGVRTLHGVNSTTGRFDKSRILEVLEKSVRGPFLVELDKNGTLNNWMFPAPADAVLFKTDDQETARRFSLTPIDLPDGMVSDLQGYKLASFSNIIKDKPLSEPPRFWFWKEFEEWLTTPTDGEVRLDGLGISGLPVDSRTHVSIDSATGAAVPGALFQTAGLEFQIKEQGEIASLSKVKKLALAVETDATLKDRPGFLGGERRVVQWKQASTPLPKCPQMVRQTILKHTACRLILITPAYFEDGYLPQWLTQAFGIGVEIISAIVNRYQTISGWDYAYQQGKKTGRPKSTRRLAPLGSVYFLKLFGTESEIQNFIDKTWLMPVSDDPQSRLDGFGIAVLGTWNGQLRKMEAPS